LAAELSSSKELMQQLINETAAGLAASAAGAARLKVEVARSGQKLASLEVASESLREQLTSERVGRQKAQATANAAEQRAAAADERVARETQQLRDEAEEAIADRDALEKASKTRNARFAKVQTAHAQKLEALEAELNSARLAGSQANQKLEQEVGRLTRHVSALEATLQDSEASAVEAAEAAADSQADASAAKAREQEMRESLGVMQEEARQATTRAKEAEACSTRWQARAEAAEAAIAAADEARVAATQSAAQEVEAAGGAIEALIAERDAAKANAASLTEQIDALVGRQGRLVEEMMAQEEKLQRLLGDGAVDRRQVANALVAFFQVDNTSVRFDRSLVGFLPHLVR
jgi:chromosome segregation protein